MKVKGNLLFSNQSFMDSEETQPAIININATAYIGSCNITSGMNTGPKTKVIFDDDNYIILEEDIEDVVTELWNNYGKD